MKRRLAMLAPVVAFMLAMVTTAGVVVAVGAGGTVVGGQENTARGESATVSGGGGNIADGLSAIEAQSKQIEGLEQHNQSLEARIAALEQAMGQVQ